MPISHRPGVPIATEDRAMVGGTTSLDVTAHRVVTGNNGDKTSAPGTHSLIGLSVKSELLPSAALKASASTPI